MLNQYEELIAVVYNVVETLNIPNQYERFVDKSNLY